MELVSAGSEVLHERDLFKWTTFFVVNCNNYYFSSNDSTWIWKTLLAMNGFRITINTFELDQKNGIRTRFHIQVSCPLRFSFVFIFFLLFNELQLILKILTIFKHFKDPQRHLKMLAQIQRKITLKIVRNEIHVVQIDARKEG